MSRPQHLSTPNTPEGIRRINEMQERYDQDPGAYEAEEQARVEYEAQMEAEQRAQYEAEMNALAEAQAQAEAEMAQQEGDLYE